MWMGTGFPGDFSTIPPLNLFKEMYHCRCLDAESNLGGCAGYCKSVANQLVENKEGERWTHCPARGETCKKKACPGHNREKKRRLDIARYAQKEEERVRLAVLCATAAQELEAAKAAEVARAKERDEERRFV